MSWTDRNVDIFDRERPTCVGCHHWNRYHPKSDNGYLEAMCQQASDVRDYEIRRASDYCSKWKGRP